MKSLVSVLFFMLLVSCNGKSGSSSSTRSCTYNDEPVDCDALTSNNEGSTRPAALILKASVTSEIEIQVGQFIFLENQEDIVAETSGGADYTCGVETRADSVILFKLEGKKLVLTHGTEKLTLNRESGEGRGLEGKWVVRENDDMGLTITTMVFSRNQIQYSQECRFN